MGSDTLQTQFSCNVCEDLASGQWRYWSDYQSVSQLHVGIENGCEICRILKEGIKASGQETDVMWSLVDTGAGEPLHMRLRSKSGTNWKGNLEFYTRSKHPSRWPAFGVGREVSIDPLSEGCVNLVSDWINDCTREHIDCSGPHPTVLPTRVIDVGSEFEEPKLRISNSSESAKYAALSYCWGKIPFLKTTASTLSKHKAGIPFDKLPETFRDAILLCRKLQIRYLWIDALCIIQGSKEDWEKESTKMAQVYGNAYVTLVAFISQNTYEGCFPRKRHLATSVEIPCQGADGTMPSIYVRNALSAQHEELLVWNESNTLTTRGWCFQESLMSRRLLIFTDTTIVWDCLTIRECECSPKPLDPIREGYHSLRRSCANSIRDDLSSDTLHAAWTVVVDSYTKRDFSHITDRLPALSAIAESMARWTNDTYIAGLWKGAIVPGLLWQNIAGWRESRKRLSPYYAPSWTWASVTGMIFFDEDEEFATKRKCSVIEAVCVPATLNPFGPAKSGHLKLRSMIFDVSLVLPPNEFAGVEFRIRGSHEDALGHIEEYSATLDVCDEGIYEIKDGAEHKIILITYTADYARFLLLQASNNVPGAFERIGQGSMALPTEAGSSRGIESDAGSTEEITLV
ncbi:HET-domain-containing protein [Patellaria atrata CBS 101060]|uniref:HET-domain-containing protein n=1 Tax=Patellaria atrata CBS 101060 TaxID=1346257 RepID=A0A9P4S988_9PEZI|nr:HET-domain-containing protein [Patellaria atrata CBS 101060]